MLATPSPLPKMTATEYLEWETQQETRHEFLNGEIIAMSGGTLSHNQLALNLYSILRPQLASKGCRAFAFDAKVNALEVNAYFYPDVVVTCNEEDLEARDTITFPTLITEVLSPSTSNYDRGDKFTFYRTIPTLQEYVLINPTQMSVECYRRGEGRMWLYFPYTQGDLITFDSLDISLKIEDIYEDIRFSS